MVKPRVFVTDAQRRAALAVIRALGKKGIEVTAGDSVKFAPAFKSKFCHRSVVYPSPAEHKEKFLDWLRTHLRKNRYDVLFPVYDPALDPIIENLEEISKYTRVPFSDRKTYQKARNKAETIRVALGEDIPCPETYFIEDLEEISSIGGRVEYPAVIKPRSSAGARGLSVVRDPEELEREYNRIHQNYPYPLVQEYIPPEGEAYGVEALFNRDHEPRAVFVHHRLREYPPSGGPSTLRESVEYPELVEMGVKLLKALNWYGVAMVEFKTDPRNGEPKLMEINPRFWGSLALPIHAGINFPYLLYKMAMEGDVKPVDDYQVGVRCRWLPGDILSFLRDKDRFKKNPSFFTFRDQKYDILSWEDPGPTLELGLFFLSQAFKKEFWKEKIFR